MSARAPRTPVRGARVSAVASFAIVAAALVPLGGSCKKDPGSPFSCVCNYLSEDAQKARRTFTVCALNEKEANAFARSCTGPGDVDGCECEAAREGSPCQSGCGR